MQRNGVGAVGGRWILAVAGAIVLGSPGEAVGQRLADYDYEHLTFRGFGLDVGYIWPDRVESTPAYSLRVDLGYLGPGVRVAPSLTYWSSSFKRGELDRLAERINRLDPLQEQGVELRGSDLGPVDWRNLSLSLDGHFVWAAPLGLLPYIGAGAALHVMSGGGPVIDDTFVEELLDRVAAGAVAIAGFEFETGRRRLRIYGEGRYSVLSNLRYPSVRIGGALLVRNQAGWVGFRGPGSRAPAPVPPPPPYGAWDAEPRGQAVAAGEAR